MKKTYVWWGIAISLLIGAVWVLWPQSKNTAGVEPIIVVSREVGSGTRGAFVDIMRIFDDNGDDAITVEADVLNGTSGVMQTVAGNPAAIGYISLGSLDLSVKPVAIDGVAISSDAVKKGDYKVARPFNLAWSKTNLTPIADDFLTYIFSQEGQKLVEASGYISVGARPKEGQTHQDTMDLPLEVYQPSGLSGQINVVGSTSLTPVMEKLAENYMKLNPQVKISITSNGSTAGLASAMDGTADLGMASRELKENEQAQLSSVAFALDGIVIIVNNQSPIHNLSFETVRNIYNGSIVDWAQVPNN